MKAIIIYTNGLYSSPEDSTYYQVNGTITRLSFWLVQIAMLVNTTL
ncbi:hypothetical protein QNH36_02490 [Mesobacillus sp. AQ2]|nr:hypothetical protein [Mesobacillus sp. AQ2]WHX41052.1 hypothetical protein QNH36_02490 [Mesobacillus sp. AQ2]